MIKGLDLSHWNTVNFSKIPKDIVFTGIKCTQGVSYIDPSYKEKLSEARRLKMGIIHYHFSDGGDYKKEFNWFLKNLDLQENELIALDFEGPAISILDPIGWCNKFVQYCFDTLKFWPLMYSYSSFIAKFKATDLVAKNCGLWVADPSNKPRIGVWNTWAVWQYAQSSNTPYSVGAIDQNYFNGTIEQFKKYGKPAITAESEFDYKGNLYKIYNAVEKFLERNDGENPNDDETTRIIDDLEGIGNRIAELSAAAQKIPVVKEVEKIVYKDSPETLAKVENYKTGMEKANSDIQGYKAQIAVLSSKQTAVESFKKSWNDFWSN